MSRLAHNQEILGSIPRSATSFEWYQGLQAKIEIEKFRIRLRTFLRCALCLHEIGFSPYHNRGEALFASKERKRDCKGLVELVACPAPKSAKR